jgi:hypothetical protein
LQSSEDEGVGAGADVVGSVPAGADAPGPEEAVAEAEVE